MWPISDFSDSKAKSGCVWIMEVCCRLFEDVNAALRLLVSQPVRACSLCRIFPWDLLALLL